MNEPSKQPNAGERHEAIDVSDFVYAATGARVRRLTMPDGTHWFPAVDVCKELGHTNSRKALSDHVPEEHREILETVTGGYGLSIPAGREWRRDMNLIDLQGLILLVQSCTKAACAPFKQWAAEVIETVQREGSYTLEEAEVQPAEPGAPIAYAMPEQVAEAIVRLEAHNLQLDEELANGQRESISLQKEMLAIQRETLATQKATLAVQQALVRAMERIADRFDALVLERRAPGGHLTVLPTTESVLADWRERLSVTEDVWLVAVVIAPVLVERGELREPLESIAARTGLSVRRVNECLRLLRKHACIRSQGAAEDGAPVYVLNQL
ncbi:BRO-N domain-containing protein [Streptomyces diastatochromogenes]|uniref:DNA-binding protein n=1 Tax=Streptomyces diastatochromogenes TaxID=42236 RepID=A0A233SBJ0_STRDA|nr:Bro-N domain-containing protein [Streptomyces diastatochromogenes]MCZ0988056.1 Bro-N domain-containing protein [Streptomyces diastatochromogenes]OXY93030.1 DNA-binding protein [Streptomyces diastatochromogenes]